MSRFKKYNEKGEALIEAIIALAVAVAISTGIVAAIISAVSGTNSNENSSDALNLAQEGMNTIKNQASTDFITFNNHNGLYCLAEDGVLRNVSNCQVGETNISLSSNNTSRVENYRRTVLITHVGVCAGGIAVSTIVQWTDSKCKNDAPNCHQTEIDSCITNTDALPAP